MPGASGVALLSGGLDSGVATALFLAGGGRLASALFCDYGQRARGPEQRAASALAARFGVELRTIALPWLGELAARAGSRLVP
ncbi:MAG: 7-cyano-7-deazaguanine synthase, partial [Planctomycetota bacterium]